MNLPLKTLTTKTAIELCSHHSDTELELCGCCALEQVNQPLYYAVKNKAITEDNSFLKVFGFDVCFFYALEQIKDGKIVKNERGIGSLRKEGDKILLKRDVPVATGNGDAPHIPCEGKCTYFNCTDCEHLIAYSTLPVNYGELLLHANTLITSVAPFVPSALVVENNSLVGRLDDDLTSLSIEDVVHLIASYTKQLVLKTSRLESKRIVTKTLELQNNSSQEVRKGSLIYNEEENALKFYDGKNWKRILYEDS